jgi:hypothetical protein
MSLIIALPQTSNYPYFLFRKIGVYTPISYREEPYTHIHTDTHALCELAIINLHFNSCSFIRAF